MASSKVTALLREICESPYPSEDALAALLALANTPDAAAVYDRADEIRRQRMGEGILLRGLLEFSNHCRNTCCYCGLARGNGKLARYRMTDEEVLSAASSVAETGIRTVVLQSGEDDALDPEWLAGVIKNIKARYGMAVTLSVGERTDEEYRLWRAAGADRYLLRIETTDAALYAAQHAGRTLATRLACLASLERLGYQTGSGIMVGLPGQTALSIARDIAFFAERGFDMIGIGPFIPHPDTPFAAAAPGDIGLTLMTVALTRIVTRDAHMPSTTALGSLGGDHRLSGLKAGANVLMPNFTPAPYRELYEIYPGKRCVNEQPGSCVGCMERMAATAGRAVDLSRGDGLRRRGAPHV